MRFVFVDRIVALDPGSSIEVVKNVSATEDFFDDHFPGFPVFPGALMVEIFDQASQLLVGATHEWTRLGELRTVSACAFRRLVRPGDRIVAHCQRRGDDADWRLRASASVDGQVVATATLVVAVTPAAEAPDGPARATRLAELMRVLTAEPPALVP